jgi:putative flippase GtrA
VEAAARGGHRLAKLLVWAFEAGKFGAVGAVAFLVDNGLYLLLIDGPGEVMAPWPVRASVVASLIATGLSYLGNRYWTFSGKRGRLPAKEIAMFVAANLAGMLITAACLYFSRWVLSFDSSGADVVARNIGIALGTIFRYLAYKFWVFSARKTETP